MNVYSLNANCLEVQQTQSYLQMKKRKHIYFNIELNSSRPFVKQIVIMKTLFIYCTSKTKKKVNPIKCHLFAKRSL